MVGLTATARAAGKALSDVRLVFFGVGTTPVRARTAEAALAAGDVDVAAKAVATELDPSDDVQASSAVKRQLAQILLKRVAGELMEGRQ
jgi:carbon-monoxide dehydrogenase medium subunit